MTRTELDAKLKTLDDLATWAKGLDDEVDGISLLQYKIQVQSSATSLKSQVLAAFRLSK